MLVLKNGTIVTGDGQTLMEKGSLIIEGEKISDVVQGYDPGIENYAEEVINCEGKAILPGMINHHQHGVTFGPIFASGAQNYGGREYWSFWTETCCRDIPR